MQPYLMRDDLRYDDKWHEINPFLLFGENNTNVLNSYFKSPKKQEHLLLHCQIDKSQGGGKTKWLITKQSHIGILSPILSLYEHKTEEEILAKKRPSNHLKTPAVSPKKLKKLNFVELMDLHLSIFLSENLPEISIHEKMILMLEWVRKDVQETNLGENLIAKSMKDGYLTPIPEVATPLSKKLNQMSTSY
jgi:hypothetical protein